MACGTDSTPSPPPPTSLSRRFMHTMSLASSTSSVATAPQLTTTSMGSSLKVPVQFFLDRILPPLRPGLDPAAIIHHLKTTGPKFRRAITAANRWRGCPSVPSELNRPQHKTFDFFRDAVHAIMKAGNVAAPGLNRLFNFFHNPNRVHRWNLRRTDTLPDAYFSPTVPRNHLDIGVVGEYKTEDSEDDKDDARNSLTL